MRHAPFGVFVGPKLMIPLLLDGLLLTNLLENRNQVRHFPPILHGPL